MTDALTARLDEINAHWKDASSNRFIDDFAPMRWALRDVVKLHPKRKGGSVNCEHCCKPYPCATIRAVAEALGVTL